MTSVTEQQPRPATRTVSHADDFFGTTVADPFRWLEDTESAEIGGWLDEQAAHTRAHLDSLPDLPAITKRLTRLWNVPRCGLPHRHGSRWFRTVNDGEQQQDVYVVADRPLGEGSVLIDPNPVAADGSTSLSAAVPSKDGALVAYSLAEAGSDWQTWRVRDVETDKDRPDVIRWSKFTLATWLPDGSGFFYGGFEPPPGDSTYVAANTGHRLYLHRLGTPQAEDILVLALPDEPDWTFWPEVTDDGHWLVVSATQGTEHRVRAWVRDLTDTAIADDTPLRPLIERAEVDWTLVGSVGDALVAVTDRDAPRGKLVRRDLATGEETELVAEGEDLLESAYLCGGRIVVHRLRDAHSALLVHDLDGRQVGAIQLPGIGSVGGVAGKPADSLLHLEFATFTAPASVLAHDLESGETRTVFAPDVDVDPQVTTEQVWIESRDGTSLPMFLIHRADLAAARRPHPTLLYGYGGFRVPVTPAFDLTRYAFAEAGGVVAIPSLRGGGEYGATWHDAGRLAAKQNVFDDAIAAARWLTEKGWTDSAHLAANGRSNGGLLAGALLTQAPELFAAVVPEVGVLDLLRFQHFTIGWAWVSDYGNADASEPEFQTLLAYSPYHRIAEGWAYPPTMVLTGDHDDRVVPAHSFKFAARLQSVSPDGALALLRVERSTGHGSGKPRRAVIAERADVLAFISHHTGLTWPTG